MKKAIYSILLLLCFFTVVWNQAHSSDSPFLNDNNMEKVAVHSRIDRLMEEEGCPFPFRQVSDKSLSKTKLKVLTIDGGGVRGILPLIFLAKMEQETGRRCSEMFDVIAGTSTGGMIALALSIASAQEILDLYMNNSDKFLAGRNIFSWLIGPKYLSNNRARIFQQFFGNRRLSDAKVPTLVTAWDLGREKAYHLYSKWPTDNVFDHEHLDMYMFDAALATSSVPTYFKPVTVKPLKVNGNPTHQTYTFVDGAMFANNPSMIAVNYAMTLHPHLTHADIDVLSLGTGFRAANYNVKKASCWGTIGWLNPLLRIFPNGNSTSIDSDLRRLLNDRYDRVNAQLTYASSQLDAAGSNLLDLQRDGELMLREYSDTLKKWVEKLQSANEVEKKAA